MTGLRRLRTTDAETAIRSLPTVCVCASIVVLAWHRDGSVLAADWLPYAMIVALLVASILLSSAGCISRHPLACAALAGGFGLWTGISAIWSPVPALARDEFLLSALYVLALALQALTLRTARSRTLAVAIFVLTLGASAVGVAVQARFGADPVGMYPDGRLTAPVSYVNAQAALFLVGLWPALVLAARRGERTAIRAVALAAAVAMLAGWLGAQSKGGAIAIALSTVIVFAVLPGRLRLLVPTLIATLLVAAQYHPLTAPFREQGDVDIARNAGGVALLLTAAALVLGVAYSLADSRLRVSRNARTAAAIAVAAAAVVLIALGAWEANRRVDEPRTWLSDQWESFKSSQETETGSSHLVNLGSNRYDFWRVSLAGFRDHPVGGVGGRGFGPLYLQERRSYETPARAHSLPLDALLETGLIGFALLAATFAAMVAALVRRRETVAGAAAFGALIYFAIHATGDWVWTFPAVGLPIFALVGTALASERGRPVMGRTAAVSAAAVTVFALVAFLPPWLSARITDAALAGTTSPDSLRWATRLDPLTVEPYLAEAALADRPEEAIPPLEQAAEHEPRSAAVRLYLGRAYLDAGRTEEAERELLVARELFPGDEEIAEELARARR